MYDILVELLDGDFSMSVKFIKVYKGELLIVDNLYY